jgi:effector-binding domain-containing protein
VSYPVALRPVVARPFAAVRARMPIAEVPRRFGPLLGKVYEAAKGNAIALDGLNIFVYRSAPAPLVDVEFGVGITAPFAPIGDVFSSEVPGGLVATTTHWGDYGGLGAAHAAVASWCRSEGHALAGVSWEEYGHWSDDPAARRTDVFHLIQPT